MKPVDVYTIVFIFYFNDVYHTNWNTTLHNSLNVFMIICGCML